MGIIFPALSMGYDAFISQVPEPSKLQDDVISELISIGLEPEEEVLTKSGYLRCSCGSECQASWCRS